MNTTLKIFIVDDEVDFLAVIERTLTVKGFEVRVFSDAFDLFDALEKSTPDIILTDIMMPVMSGHSLGHHLKTKHPNINVAIISGLEPETHKDRMDFWGENTPYFQKPLDMDALLKYLKSL